MAQDLKPSTWIPSWSEDATNVTFPIASIPELTAAEADADTGNISKVMSAMLECIYQAWLAQDAADRPTKMTICRSTSVNDVTGAITRTYQFQFAMVVTGEEVDEEA
jgi:hypothetical protein